MSSAGLLRFFFALRVASFAFALVQLGVAWFARSAALALVAGGLFAMAAATWGCRSLVLRGRGDLAATVIGHLLLVCGAVLSPLVPHTTPAFALVPILAVSAVLPFVRGRALRFFFVWAFLATLWIVASAGTFDIVAIEGLLGRTINALGTCVTSFLALFTLWHFSERLRAALDDETKAVRVRDEFLSFASHELRTPLTSLQLSVDALVRGSAEQPVSSGFERSLALVERQVGKLSRLVSEMLNVGQIQMGRVELVRADVELAGVVREVAERLGAELKGAGCVLELRLAPVHGAWDRDKIDHVVTNVLVNAIRFGAGHPIEVTLELGEREARLTVVDHGIGIVAADLPRVFQRFERDSSRSHGGLGLGLFVARGIVDAHGGRIWAASAGVGTGASVVVELPRDLSSPR